MTRITRMWQPKRKVLNEFLASTSIVLRGAINHGRRPIQGPNGKHNLFYNRLMRLFFHDITAAELLRSLRSCLVRACCMAIPSVGDVATSALTRPTRRMCNQSSGHRGGQVRSGRRWPPPSPGVANGCHTVSGACVAGCRLLVASCWLRGPSDEAADSAAASAAERLPLEGVITFLLKPPHTHLTGAAFSLCYFIGGSQVPSGKWKTPMKLRLVSGVHKHRKFT